MRRKKSEKLTPEEALSYRTPLPVTEVFLYREKYEYPICPRCKVSMEREYQFYCDRCGQALDWKKYGK